MAGDDPSSPTISGGKHRRSPDATREESSKRRKHRHRHRHSHRHGRDRKEEEDDSAKPIETEIEEGEILDDEQSGEIKLEGSDSNLNKIRETVMELDDMKGEPLPRDDASNSIDNDIEMVDIPIEKNSDLGNGIHTQSKGEKVKSHKRREDLHNDKSKRSASPGSSQEKSPSHRRGHRDNHTEDESRKSRRDKRDRVRTDRHLSIDRRDQHDILDRNEISDNRDRHGSLDRRDRHGSRERRDRHGSRERRDRHGSRERRDRHGSRDRRDRHDSRDRMDIDDSHERRDRRDSRDRRDRHGSRDKKDRDDSRERLDRYESHDRHDRHESRDRRDNHERSRREKYDPIADLEKERRGRDKERERRSSSVRGRDVESKRDSDGRDQYYDHRVRDDERRRDKEDNRGRYHDDRERVQGIDSKDSDRRKERESKDKRTEEIIENSIREEEEEDDEQDKVEQQLVQEDEEERIKEESRKRRQAILEKYRQQQMQKQELEFGIDNTSKEKNASKEEVTEVQESTGGNATSPIFDEEPDNENDSSDVDAANQSFALDKSPNQEGALAKEKALGGAAGLGEGTPKSERSADMFCDDIFGDSPAKVRKVDKVNGFKIERSGLHDNWDDAEGYYSYRFGEVLDGRYEIIAAHGKGVFSTVVRAKDLKSGKNDPQEVAIKIIRNNETMYKAGMDELVILKKLAGADPEDRRHCVRFISSFKYRNHLCLVFESLHMNLREVLKKFGRNIGLKLTAVRAYAKQLFIALKHLRNCGVLHCDIKPDNMLVNEAKNVLKLCDFGNAMFAGKNEITPYLVSRFYRAPEIILGLPYDHPLDIWSVGCCLYELYTGKVLFPGPSNNDMLRLQMELKGPFPKKMLRKAAFVDQHFDHDLNFLATEEDPVTKKMVKRLLLNVKPKDMGALISTFPGEDVKLLANFKDLLERIFILDPEKRMTVSQALSHPFITGK
ncbi:hypothetical protein LUZ61_001412 [Rhynchospora tenuis]|uniref:Serine/threonine-protein kinase PRP4 homolog n=1 Tax=Rhynchospora tenuis TaxID=198213 RepID=A0AAD6EQR6_9POAL|nr:hypothetical protein LUZ61_001412 [Rhynchospora tenuis]